MKPVVNQRNGRTPYEKQNPLEIELHAQLLVSETVIHDSMKAVLIVNFENPTMEKYVHS